MRATVNGCRRIKRRYILALALFGTVYALLGSKLVLRPAGIECLRGRPVWFGADVSRRAVPRYVIDAFPFSNELDVLEMRLNVLAGVVDLVILYECHLTYTLEPKSMVFSEHRHEPRFAQFLGKIVYVTCTEDDVARHTSGAGQWRGEVMAYSVITRALEREIGRVAGGSYDNIMFVSGDVDEIPRPELVRDLRHVAAGDFPYVVQMLSFKYNFGCVETDNWRMSTIGVAANLRRFGGAHESLGCAATRTGLRFDDRRTRLSCGGWHCSSFMPPEGVAHKLHSYSHASQHSAADFRVDTIQTYMDECRGWLFVAGRLSPLRFYSINTDTSIVPAYARTTLRHFLPRNNSAP